jgi:hypothetical protein
MCKIGGHRVSKASFFLACLSDDEASNQKAKNTIASRSLTGVVSYCANCPKRVGGGWPQTSAPIKAFRHLGASRARTSSCPGPRPASACGRGDSRTATPDLQSKAPRFGQVMGVVQLHHSFLFGSFPQLKIGRPNQCRKHKTVGVTVPQAKLIGFVVSALGRLAEDDRPVKRTCGWPLVADFAIPNW